MIYKFQNNKQLKFLKFYNTNIPHLKKYILKTYYLIQTFHHYLILYKIIFLKNHMVIYNLYYNQETLIFNLLFE